jgi:hypothetical protein
MDFLINIEPTTGQEWALGRRFAQDRRARRRAFKATEATQMAATMRPRPNR